MMQLQALSLLLTLSLALLLVVTPANPAPDWTDCPSSCRCKWTQGKKSALCKDAGFTAIPGSLDSDMQVLDLAGNRIPYLMQDAFKSVGLLNLQRIFLKNAGVIELHRDAFRDLKILVEVDLSDNLIKTVHQDTFSGNDRLRVLYLNGNPISELRVNQFPVLPHLRTLDLSHCALKLIHREAFVHLAALETLTLNDNRLQLVSETVFLPTGRLKTLKLDGNPWKCSCELRGFRNWLLESNLYSEPLSCQQPEVLKGRKWEEVVGMEFACAPEVTLQESMVQEEPGGNVTFRCRIKGDPEPTVSWLFNGRSLGNATSPVSSHPSSVSSQHHSNTLQGDTSVSSHSSSVSSNALQMDGSVSSHALQVDDLVLVTIDEEEGEIVGEKWSTLTMLNVTDLDAGEYTCAAINLRGRATANVSLILPEVITATTLSKREPWLKVAVWAGAAVSMLLMSSLLLICLACRVRRKAMLRGKKGAARRQMKGSASFSDQDKRLLDVSITTTTDGRAATTGSCDGLSQQDMEMMETSMHSLPLEVCDQPVHITIESHSGATSTLGAHPPTSIEPVVFPPPPEFSGNSTLPATAYGNIFISVSVGQDGGPVEPPRYPDLLDLPHRKSKSVGTDTSAYFPTLSTSATESSTYFTTLPPRSATEFATLQNGVSDQAQFFTTLPRQATLPNGAATDPQPVYGPGFTELPRSATTFATLPRQPSSKVLPPTKTIKKVDQCISTTTPKLPPHYDNMGPRVTAKGSCSTLSLPDATNSLSTQTLELSSQTEEEEDILPPPPPPPLCSPLTVEYVSL
ncbi:LOW QUALITY PROTEIN: leucine-rich repeat-containing protein 24 [Nilaparvata lugens]|uniref:LOW QUALITY PROTEIN: leucine-rich repeat-containing protein 24 n=1 Tax=Nilaparvata lugens TaxID=108931 RepID=UPI00193CE968|nr:LOW QUALITY PROTEIN: leucine-rich repeat-containing protein 24 [Nilaparvata lugens]